MKKIMLIMVIILLLSLSLVSAMTQQEINEAKSLIDSKVDCKSLSDSQLEIIGEYEMELMHPGQSHDTMHQMMGIKEGSDAEKQFHISMAKKIYCGESGEMMDSGMMMGNGNTVSSGMMGGGYFGPVSVLYYLLVALLLALLILAVLWIIKLWRGLKAKGDHHHYD